MQSPSSAETSIGIEPDLKIVSKSIESELGGLEAINSELSCNLKSQSPNVVGASGDTEFELS